MPGIVQVAANAASATSVTVTLGAGTTGGNTLVATAGDSADTTNGTVSGITLGGSADNWAQKATEGTAGDHAFVAGWADPGCANNQTSVVVSFTGGTGDHLFAWVFEASGLTGTLDVSSGGSTAGFAASWTSGTTAATAQASEIAFGITCGSVNGTPGTTPGLTGPSSPWVNETVQSVNGASHTKDALAGYQILSATGTQVYSGTASPTNTNDTLVFTLKAVSNVTGTLSLAMAPMAEALTGTETISGIASLAAAPMKLSLTGHETGANITGTLSMAMAPMKLAAASNRPGGSGVQYPYHHRGSTR